MTAKAKTFDERIKEAHTKREMVDWVQKVYAETERYIEPMPPFIFVRTLPRATITSSGIILPEKQNKPNIEGIVLAVYKPFWEKVEKVTENGVKSDISVYNECDIKVGDHVVLPHHCGLPDSFLDEREYRLIREDDAIATVHYREKGWLEKELKDLMLHQTVEVQRDDAETIIRFIIRLLQDKFDLVPKEILSRTTSGK